MLFLLQATPEPNWLSVSGLENKRESNKSVYCCGNELKFLELPGFILDFLAPGLP